MSRTVIDLDDYLMGEAARVLGTRTKQDTVNAALREVLANRRRPLTPTRLREAASDGAFDLTLLADKRNSGGDPGIVPGWPIPACQQHRLSSTTRHSRHQAARFEFTAGHCSHIGGAMTRNSDSSDFSWTYTACAGRQQGSFDGEVATGAGVAALPANAATWQDTALSASAVTADTTGRSSWFLSG